MFSNRDEAYCDEEANSEKVRASKAVVSKRGKSSFSQLEENERSIRREESEVAPS